ncbi:MAG: RNA-directed DNA polymerase [Lentilactobacillus diolivorans]|jgi:hypothetical protein|nr:RNA-directed DNA polymerase [Lentilactobacillus diolivorans]
MKIKSTRRSVLAMDKEDAKAFFLKPTSYVTTVLPEYFDFSKVLKYATDQLSHSTLNGISVNKNSLSHASNTNYTLLINKDGRYDWRPIEIVHPILYVDLVNCLIEKWDVIKARFKEFREDPRITCISIPVKSESKQNDQAETIMNWWENLEQRSIKYALTYSYCIKTDITNCYGSIYTHSISWALHGVPWSKEHRKYSDGIGNMIDHKIQNMQYGQTNGIPQGGVLFDFIAEIVLGYADLRLSEQLSEDDEFKVIRYRDDYRIFANSKDTAEKVIKTLSDVLAQLNMHFNSKKTGIVTDIVGTAVKPDKIFWTKVQPIISTKLQGKIQYHLSIQKHLWQIYELSKKYPNSGSIKKALKDFLIRIQKLDKMPSDCPQVISIISSVIVNSPNSIPFCVAIISLIFNKLSNTDNLMPFVGDIIKRLKIVPNTGFIEIWLQRLSILIDKNYNYGDPLCQKVFSNVNIWNSEWLNTPLDESSIVDYQVIDQMKLVIPQNTIDIFSEYP